MGLVIITGPLIAEEDELFDLYMETEKPVRVAPAAPGQVPEFLQPTEIKLEVRGVSSDKGKVLVVLYDNDVAFRSMSGGDAVGFIEAPATRGTTAVTIQAIGETPYAAFAYHDENEDGTLNMDRGVPTEGYGYSGAVDPYRPPRFEQAATLETEGVVRLTYIPRHPGR